MHKSLHISCAVGFCILVLALPIARAQDQQNQGQSNQDQQQGQQNTDQSAPIPAYHSPLASEAGNDESDEENQTLTPDTQPLSGAQTLSLGGVNRSYWQPHADIFGAVDSNPAQTPTGSSWGTWASFSGGVDVHRISGNSNVTLNYLGGASISSDGYARNGIIQNLGFVDALTLRRWTLAFIDQVSYLPDAAFGFGGLGGVQPSTGGTVGLGPVFGVPGQTILTGTGQSLANASTVEADRKLTSRTSVTFDGGYSLLHYFDSDLLNSTDATFRGGYNYLLTPKDTIAAFFTYSAFRYNNVNQSIDDYTIDASYARRVTGRLAFQIAAGPQIAQSRIPITANSGSGGTGTATTSSTQLYWSLNTNLQYQLQRVALGFSYHHGVDAGAGVFGGSVADVVSGSVTRQMSRTFSSSVRAGYSRNTGLIFTSMTPSNQTYDYWYLGASFSHPMGRSLGLTLSYQLQVQNSNGSFCVGPTCGTSLTRNVISFGVGWHERPLLF
jgi:hypothetical protein